MERRTFNLALVVQLLTLYSLGCRSLGGLDGLRAAMKAHKVFVPEKGRCDFDFSCDWRWNNSDDTFRLVQPPLPSQLAPTADADGNPQGHFLYLSGKKQAVLNSTPIERTSLDCSVEFNFYQVDMEHGRISLIIETYNGTKVIANERDGSNAPEWQTAKFILGRKSQEFIVILEVETPYENSSFAVDNIRMVDCADKHGRLLPPESGHGECKPPLMFKCNNGSCLKRDHVCDLRIDCADEEDETGECDKVPDYARCSFEGGWCGWSNEPDRPLNWTLNHVTSAQPFFYTDHTYRNSSHGTYAFVDMTNAVYGSRGTLRSPIFNPTPPYHDDATSQYYKSCKLRFAFYKHGPHQVALAVYLVELRDHHNHTSRIFWSFRERNNVWNSQAMTLPPIRFKYYLQFEATKSYQKADIAIDDISLSPECFGVGVPDEVVGDFNYYNQKVNVVPSKHNEFINQTMIVISTCGQTGRFGPTPEQCPDLHGNTTELPPPAPPQDSQQQQQQDDEGAVKLKHVKDKLREIGIQRWVAPSDGYYTIIATGARGGTGALTVGVSLGGLVRGVAELRKGQELFFMVGQPGTDACPKSLGMKDDACLHPNDAQSTSSSSSSSSDSTLSSVARVKSIELRDGAGGGGGATYVFSLGDNGSQQPLMVAAGGGGLGPSRYTDDDVQHAKGFLPNERNPVSGNSDKKNSGAGGGWLSGTANETVANGQPLSKGGIGGMGCGPNQTRGHGDGGFGGGGGGCLHGGGGGGYAGGNTGGQESGNGAGGYSYASADLQHVHFEAKANGGPGEVIIIPAIVAGCDCASHCVVLDRYLSEVQCLCPPGKQLNEDDRNCDISRNLDLTYRSIMETVVVVLIIAMVIALLTLCVILYQRYQNKKELKRRRQVMFGNGTELTSLRVVSDSMMTEFNPNYEFAGNLYSFKDLPQIPRDNISLVKPLGQGAFGEVYQGIYKYRREEEHPVAVKTLPSLSTSQAEADFMMEALIMSKFNHPNIVHFIGVSFDKHPRYIVLELLAGGDLKNFLREERPKPDRPTSLNMKNLIMCAYDVAKGCKYMEDSRFIHRDIAARNCLLTCKHDPNRAVKIADFGMARDIYRSDYYRKGGKAMLPIKWMPPESFLDGIFTTKTDVWAFGVLLWEIMSFGYMPYTGCANREVMSMVTSGGRLEKPAGCPDPIYSVMTKCWHPRPEERPSFATIVERIGYCLQDPDVCNHPTPNYDSLPICDREITIMRPDPETECINVHPDIDGYMQPRTNYWPTTYRFGHQPQSQSQQPHPPGIVYASLKHDDASQRPSSTEAHLLRRRHSSSTPDDDEHDRDEPTQQPRQAEDESNANVIVAAKSEDDGEEEEDNANNERIDNTTTGSNKNNGNNELPSSATNTDTESLFMPSSAGTPLDTASSSPNTRTSSPNHRHHLHRNADNGNALCSPTNVNGIRKSALKAALSLDPSALCRAAGAIPYEKISKPATNNPSQAARQGNPEGGGAATTARKDSLSHELPREEECSC